MLNMVILHTTVVLLHDNIDFYKRPSRIVGVYTFQIVIYKSKLCRHKIRLHQGKRSRGFWRALKKSL